MTQQGYESIEIAKQNGYWTILDEIEEVIVPNYLELAFEKLNGSKDYFLSLSKSTRKIILSWIILVGKQETRQKRIEEVVESAALNLKPKHLR